MIQTILLRGHNRRLKSTRQMIERAIGILKEIFPCLNHLRLNPIYAGSVVKCYATLCNLAREDDIVIAINKDEAKLDRYRK